MPCNPLVGLKLCLVFSFAIDHGGRAFLFSKQSFCIRCLAFLSSYNLLSLVYYVVLVVHSSDLFLKVVTTSILAAKFKNLQTGRSLKLASKRQMNFF